MTVKLIQKYKGKTIKQLKAKAVELFHKWIRERDAGQSCISCGVPYFSDAGHYYAGGKFPNLKFNENNVHGQCKKCNWYMSGNLIPYRFRLIEKIGLEEVEKLDLLASQYKQVGYKWDRFFLIEIIEKYKSYY